ncbi:MAG: 4-hydroxy-3-methylbut-2-enyl diphosphate reductase [Clostridia bacterium]|nr:4-hydroxy-3-methylbut-2-enyl diphosphate reductase [Clostridia bacterium]
MEVVVGKLAGFCPGVENTVKRAKEILQEKGTVYCLGEIVHNGQVIQELEKIGMITVENIEEVPNNSSIIFRAHGEPEYKYEIAKQKNLEIFDLTCGKVTAIHKKVQREREESFIIILGKKKHPEVLGTKGFSGENSYIVESEDDILDAYIEYEKTELGRVYVVAQTTISSKYFDILAEEIEKNFIEAEVVIDKTICNATEIRQKETAEIAKKYNTMIIIGGKNSSNTKELAKIAEENCENVYLIETVDEIKNINFSNISGVGIMAGASTPRESINNVKIYIESL